MMIAQTFTSEPDLATSLTGITTIPGISTVIWPYMHDGSLMVM